MTKSGKSSRGEKLKGSQEPCVKIAPDYVRSDGYDAARILRAGGLILDPWQRDVLDDWLGRSASGRWGASTCGGSVPRQNGKTLLLQGRAACGMLMFNEQVLYTAHLQKTATETFEELAAMFEDSAMKKYVQDIKTALGREQIVLRSGARIKFLARTRNGGRGQHGDLLIFDEAQELDEDQQASFLPAISASLNPQTIYTGTPPDPNTPGTVFRGIRDRAREGKTKRTAWFEYSVEEIGNVNDKKRWAATNPALGRRILLSTIAGEVEQMDPDTFARERLGWWSPVAGDQNDYAIDRQAWAACMSDAPKVDGKTAYGVKFTPDGAEVALCGAVKPDSGPIQIALIEKRPTGRGVQWLADWLNARYGKTACVVIDGRNGVDALVDKISGTWKWKNSVIRPTAKEVIASVSMMTEALSERTVSWYSGMEELNHSAVTSIRRPISGGWGFGGDNSAPIEAAALALWGVKTSKRNPGKVMRIG